MILTTLADGVRSTLELERGNYLIGRGEGCRIRFTSPEVSERHAILTVTDEKAVIEDLHSANGTFVNGEPIESAVALESAMVVQIGPNLLRVSDDEEDGGRPPPPPAELEAARRLKRAKLDAMLQFVDCRGCRHKYILEYFGEDATHAKCGGCDHCSGAGARPLTEAQWIVV